MKKFVAALLILPLALCVFAACSKDGGGESSSSTAALSGEDEKPDMASLAKQFRDAFTTKELRERSANEIFDETGIEAQNYDDFFWLAQTSGLSSEKAVVFLAKDAAKAAEIEAQLDEVLQSELTQMKDYNADNYAMLQKAVLGKRDNCVWLLVSPAVDAFAAIMNASFTPQ